MLQRGTTRVGATAPPPAAISRRERVMFGERGLAIGLGRVRVASRRRVLMSGGCRPRRFHRHPNHRHSADRRSRRTRRRIRLHLTRRRSRQSYSRCGMSTWWGGRAERCRTRRRRNRLRWGCHPGCRRSNSPMRTPDRWRCASRRVRQTANRPSVLNGTLPDSDPETIVSWVCDTSRAMSAPELPRPTTSTGPPWS